jgi:hypothetical protein
VRGPSVLGEPQRVELGNHYGLPCLASFLRVRRPIGPWHGEDPGAEQKSAAVDRVEQRLVRALDLAFVALCGEIEEDNIDGREYVRAGLNEYDLKDREDHMSEWIVATYKALLVFTVWIGLAIWAILGAVIGGAALGGGGAFLGLIIGGGAGFLVSCVLVGFFMEISQIHTLLERMAAGTTGPTVQPALTDAQSGLPVAPSPAPAGISREALGGKLP